MKNGTLCKLCSLASPGGIRKTLTDLRADGTSATINRLFRSRHVLDLKLIVSVTVLVTAVAAVAALFAILLGLVSGAPKGGSGVEVSPPDGWRWTAATSAALLQYFIYIGPVLTAAGVIVAWAYRQGSTRLGVVDLFGSEISTICRAGTILDAGSQLVNAFRKGIPTPRSAPDNPSGPRVGFVSEENYFPVFESNARDLQVLEARVIVQITSFYTYMKTTRDYLRIRGQLEQTGLTDEASRERWKDVMTSLIYMFFLAYESARKAVDTLIEYEPDQVECQITILLTELKCYQFLSDRFSDIADARCARLALRRNGYRVSVPKLCSVDHDVWHEMQETRLCDTIGLTRPIDEQHPDVDSQHWERAKTTAPALWRLYKEIFDISGGARPPRLEIPDSGQSNVGSESRAA